MTGTSVTRPDCDKCKFRGSVPGSAHSRCHHPSIAEITASPIGNLFSAFASIQRTPPIVHSSHRLQVKGNPHGISHGWFNWPWNFDPIWLEECDGFEAIPEAEAES